MFTTNFYIGEYLYNLPYSGNVSELTLKTVGGTLLATPTFTSSDMLNLLPDAVYSGARSGSCVGLGAGTAEESITDYTLTGLGGNFTSQHGNVSVSIHNKTITVTKRYIINNTSGKILTVNEFGIVSRINGNYCLIYRGLLNEPFTIDINETVNFDLTVAYDLPSNFEMYEG